MANDSLAPYLKKIQGTIASLRQDVQRLTGEVKKIPTAIQEATETLRDAIQENIQAQAELKLIEHMSEVEMIKPKISAKSESLEFEQDELDSKLSLLEERYQTRHEKLDDKAAERIRDLGEHIFEIDEVQFQQEVESRFLENVTSSWMDFTATNEFVKEQRSEYLTESTKETSESINEFLTQQTELLNRIHEHKVDLSAEETEPVQLPYYVVEVETPGGKDELCYLPGKIAINRGGSSSEQYKPFKGLNELVSPNPKPTETVPVNTESLVRECSKFADDALLFVDPSSTIEDAIDQNFKIEKEA